MPLVLRRQLEFPYARGLPVRDELCTTRAATRRSTPHSRRHPASTEQILHPEKYYASEVPVDVALRDLLGQLGDGWSRRLRADDGRAAASRSWPPAARSRRQPIPGLPVDWPHAEAAAGWGGDRLNMYEHPDGRWAHRLADGLGQDADADEFEARVNELTTTFDGIGSVTRNRDRGLDAPAIDIRRCSSLTRCRASELHRSGAEIPSRPSAAASVMRVASTSARRRPTSAGRPRRRRADRGRRRGTSSPARSRRS